MHKGSMNTLDRLKNRAILNAVSAYGGICRRSYLNAAKRTDRVEKKVLSGILRRNADTEFGIKNRFRDIRTIEDYQDTVPFSVYSDYADYLDRTAMRGEQNLITSDRISFLADTSGTTGITKHIPVVPRSYAPYLGCMAMYFNLLKKELKTRGLRGGKVLNTIESESSVTPGGIRQGFISAFVVGNSRFLIENATCLPLEVLGYGATIDMKYIKARCALAEAELVGAVSAFMSTVTDLMYYITENHEMLERDIASGGIDASINIPPELRASLRRRFKPDPERAEAIRRAFSCGTHEGLVPRLWPGMSLIVAIGTGEFAPFAEKMRYYCGGRVKFCYSMYCASESLFASAVNVEDENYLMLAHAGFFEFIPVDDEFDENTMRPLLLHELEVGKHYEVVVTSLAGLYRHRINDVIVVTGYEGKSPLIRFAYRKNQLINITGIKLTAEHITNAIAGFEKRIGVKVLDYSLYPDLSRAPWRIQAFMELDGEIPSEMQSSVPSVFDEELSKVNAEHGHMLKIGESSPSVVCTVARGSYERYRAERAKQKLSGNQVKAVRYIDTPDKLEYFNSCVEKVYE